MISEPIRPRKIEGWEFFNSNVDACDSGEMAGFETLSPDDRQVPEFFIRALGGCRRVLDLGCGGGYPGLYLAPHVGELVGLDAAPNMITAALRNVVSLGVLNAFFEIGGTGRLPFADCDLDGAMFCGLMESMDWESVHRIMPEVRRVLAPGAKIAALDQDWQDVLSREPLRNSRIRLRNGRLMLQVTERSVSPHTEVDTRYIVNPDSHTGREMLAQLGGRISVPASVSQDGPHPGDVSDAEYDEAAQFDADSFAELFSSYGFADVRSESVHVPAWEQRVLFLTGRKQEDGNEN